MSGRSVAPTEVWSEVGDSDERGARIGCQSMKTLHAIDKNTINIDQPSVAFLPLLRRNDIILRKFVPQADRYTIPTCFVISPVRLDRIDKEEGSAEKIDRWLDNLLTFCDRIHDPDGGAVHELIAQLFEGSSMYFYLIDEKTMEPVIPSPCSCSIYPIKITSPAHFVPSVLPLMQMSMKAVRMMNGAAGVSKCLGLSCNTGVAVGKAFQFIGDLDEVNSRDSYGRLQTVGSKTTSLNDLVKFFAQHDTEDTFCGLYRVCTAEGLSCWTSKESADMMLLESKKELTLKYLEDEVDIVMPLSPSFTHRVSPKHHDAALRQKSGSGDHGIVEGSACVINGLARMFSTPKIHAHD